jgi:glycosyltransferase involved in cell wall biosynthesis
VRLAYFSDSFLPTHDGVSHFLLYMGRELTRQGHQVTLFTPRAPQDADRDAGYGFPVVRLPSLPLPYYPQYRWAVLPGASLAGRSGDFDVVHVHTPGPVGTTGLLAARHWGVPAVGTFHTNLKDMRQSLPDNWATRAFFRFAWRWNAGLYARCDQVTVPQEEGGRLLEGVFTHRRAPVEVIPHGVDTSRFRPGLSDPPWADRLGSRGRPLVLFCGRLTVDKGVHRLLDALARLPPELPFLGVIAGEGPESQRVRDRVRTEAGLMGRVVLVGALPESEKPSLFSQSAVFALPSTADLQPLALLEAMASGLAVVVGTQGGPARMVRSGEEGWAVDPTDPAGLAAALARLLSDAPLRARLGANARARAEARFSQRQTLRRFLDLYEGVRSRPRAVRVGGGPRSAPGGPSGPRGEGPQRGAFTGPSPRG